MKVSELNPRWDDFKEMLATVPAGAECYEVPEQRSWSTRIGCGIALPDLVDIRGNHVIPCYLDDWGLVAALFVDFYPEANWAHPCAYAIVEIGRILGTDHDPRVTKNRWGYGRVWVPATLPPRLRTV